MPTSDGRDRRRHGERDRRHGHARADRVRARVCRSASAPGCISPSSAGREARDAVRFLSDVLNGLPSIVLGIFALATARAAVQTFLGAGRRHRARGDDDSARHARDGRDDSSRAGVDARSRAGARATRKWRTSLSVVLRTALPGIVTGALVAVARIAGETAPLIFTAFGNQFWSVSPTQPIAALPMQIYHLCHSSLRRLARASLGGRARPPRTRPRHQSRRALRTRSRFGLGGD